ncbi:MAG: nuclear transport factor 2 family protein [Polyangiales bacterium]
MRLLAALLVVLGCSKAAPHVGALESEAGTTLDEWHKAAASADEEAYFSAFAKNGVFLGTDAKERWTVEAFRVYAHPHFAKGKAWTFTSVRRAISIAADGRTAWFDEDLATPHLGPARGSGVLLREDGRWKIALYDLSIPIPNEKFAEVKKIISP